jgi:hypothetical protein
MVTNNLDLPALATSWIVHPKSTNQVGGIVNSVTGIIPGYTNIIICQDCECPMRSLLIIPGIMIILNL